jgi:hypothetical protein
VGYSKRQFAEKALLKIGIASYVFDLQPEQIEDAVWALDSMLAMWNGKGIHVGYPLPSSPEFSDINAETNVPDWVNEAIIYNLAVRIASEYGKTLPMEVYMLAKEAYSVVLNRSAKPKTMQFPSNMPAGAGNKRYGVHGQDVFLNTPVDRINTGSGDFLDF